LKIKLIYILIFFCSVCSIGQIGEVATTINTPIDSSSIELKKFEENFKKKYKTADFEYEPKSKAKSAWERFKENIAERIKKMLDFKTTENAKSFVTAFFRILLILIICIAVFLIVKAILSKEGGWFFDKNSGKKLVAYDAIEKNIHAINFKEIIETAIKSGDKRAAIRYYYLWLLKKMSDSKIILWDIEKTNSDYLYEIKNETLREKFTYLSYLYNYVWYGDFEIDQITFEKTTQNFAETIHSLQP
jgi:hypothetical protein